MWMVDSLGLNTILVKVAKFMASYEKILVQKSNLYIISAEDGRRLPTLNT